MTDSPIGSTVPRRQLGRHLQRLRNDAGYTVRRAATVFEMSEAKLWRIETGRTSVRALEVEGMCRVYGAAPDVSQALTDLARETKNRDWWYSFKDVIPEGFDLYIGLEQAASEIKTYQTGLIPGLLQTEGYAQAIIRAGRPGDEDGEIERRARLRVARQAILNRAVGAPTLRIALSEAALSRQIGSREVMAEQLARLLDASRHVDLRVVPFKAGLHLGVLSGAFSILRFPRTPEGEESEPPTVYADGYAGDIYLDKPKEVDLYEATFNSIWDAALDKEQSSSFISDAARSLGNA
nr:helix-turn-helix transcriptional regulator [Kitasatospora humi]